MSINTTIIKPNFLEGIKGLNKTNIKFTYMYQPPRKYTFEMPQLYNWLIQQCEGKTLNLYAGKVVLEGVDEVRNDIDWDCPAEYHMDSLEFIELMRLMNIQSSYEEED